jgi:hypothetical protein
MCLFLFLSGHPLPLSREIHSDTRLRLRLQKFEDQWTRVPRLPPGSPGSKINEDPVSASESGLLSQASPLRQVPLRNITQHVKPVVVYAFGYPSMCSYLSANTTSSLNITKHSEPGKPGG